MFGPLVRLRAPIVSATPPPLVTVPALHFLAGCTGTASAAALAAAICAALKGFEVVIRFLAVGITTGGQMRSVIVARGPHQENDLS